MRVLFGMGEGGERFQSRQVRPKFVQSRQVRPKRDFSVTLRDFDWLRQVGTLGQKTLPELFYFLIFTFRPKFVQSGQVRPKRVQ